MSSELCPIDVNSGHSSCGRGNNLSSEKRFGQKKALFPEYMGYGPRREFADPYINFEGCFFFPVFFFFLKAWRLGVIPPSGR